MRAMLACLVVGFVAAGCGATSEHPLSDDTDSVVDERLIGWWEGVPEEEGETSPERLAVGRAKGMQRTLETVWTQIGKDGYIQIQRLRIHTTKVGDQHFLSVGKREGDTEFLIWRYTIDDQGLLGLEKMDEKAVAKAIESKQIAGTVKRNPKHGTDPLEVLEFEQVHLTADKAALRAWLAKDPPIWEGGDGKLRKVSAKSRAGR